MKKLVIVVIALLVLTGALATAGFVYAQSSNPPTPFPGGMMGSGRGRGQGGMMGARDAQGTVSADEQGWMHDGMVAAFAAKLGLSVDEINTRMAKGETMYQIAVAKGLSPTEIQVLMQDARSQAIDQAVKAGTLTQAQADWMKQRGAGMMNGQRGGMIPGGMMGGRGANGGMPCLDGDETGTPTN